MADPIVDRREQFEAIAPMLLHGEVLHAVFDLKGAGTGFIGITNKRLVFYDKQFIGRKKAMTSIPFSRVSAVSAVDEGGLFAKTSELVVKSGTDTYEFEFRGADKAQTAYQFIMQELLQPEMA